MVILFGISVLTLWGQVMHIFVSELCHNRGPSTIILISGGQLWNHRVGLKGFVRQKKNEAEPAYKVE